MVSIGEFGSKIKENISRVIVERKKTIERVLAVLISGGHVLINDVPGVEEDDAGEAWRFLSG